jgi:hypothetical protein
VGITTNKGKESHYRRISSKGGVSDLSFVGKPEPKVSLTLLVYRERVKSRFALFAFFNTYTSE